MRKQLVVVVQARGRAHERSSALVRHVAVVVIHVSPCHMAAAKILQSLRAAEAVVVGDGRGSRGGRRSGTTKIYVVRR